MTDTPIRALKDIWPLQAELNQRSGFDTRALGQAIRDAGDEAALLAAGKALKCYIDAMSSECNELQDCLAWKHWYREAKEGKQYLLQDLQNARVEVTDMLFFWISMCQILGMDPEDVFRLYEAKLGINHNRQDENRTQAEHATHEDENRTVQ
jgi:hypothetical protein